MTTLREISLRVAGHFVGSEYPKGNPPGGQKGTATMKTEAPERAAAPNQLTPGQSLAAEAVSALLDALFRPMPDREETDR